MADKAFKKIETEHLAFNWEQVAAAILRLQGIHAGWWRIGIEFGLSAAAIKWGSADNLVPGAFLPVQNITLKRCETKQDALTFDAAILNPASRLIVPAGMAVN